MKKIIYLILTICLICLIVLLKINKSTNNKYIVYVEAINDEVNNSGYGFVYKVEDNYAYIVTNYHIVKGFSNINIYNNSKKTNGIIINYDTNYDIAIIKIDNIFNLKQANFNYNYNINDTIYVPEYNTNYIYNKNNKGKINSISSNVEVKYNDTTTSISAIEISCNLTYGNSGSPLINTKDEVIGMVFSKNPSENIGYAINIKDILNIITNLENEINNTINLGATFVNCDNNDCVIVYDISSNSILKEVGINKDDLIVEINDNIISNVEDMRKNILNQSNLKIKYIHNNISNTVYLKKD